jgi:hypothetical protein
MSDFGFLSGLSLGNLAKMDDYMRRFGWCSLDYVILEVEWFLLD